jgi:hypothetical protein
MPTRIARWNITESTWEALGAGIDDGYVSGLAYVGNYLYVGGTFTQVSGVAANKIARWDGSTWEAVGDGMDNKVKELLWDGTFLYAAGQFTQAGRIPADYVAKWGKKE